MNILGLPDWNVTEVTEEAGTRVVSASYLPQPTACPKCGSIGTLEGGPCKVGTYQQRAHDLPTLGKPTVIAVRRQRYQCRDCKGTFSQPLPDLDEKGTMTARLADFIRHKSVKRTFVSIAEEVGVTEGTVRNVFREYAAFLDANVKFITPEVLGIDELHLLGQARCILTNVEERSVVGLLPTRTKEAVYRHLLTMPDRERVKYVCMDMWPAYRDAARAVWPDVTVIVDKFHVVRMASVALEKVRKDLRASLTDKLRRNLMHDRFVLLKRGRDLNERQRLQLEAWTGKFPNLKDAYELKEGLYDLFDAPITSAEAKERYAEWQGAMTTELAPAFKDVTTAITNWNAEVFNYFDHRVTNAYTEAVNGLAKIANRNGRGYSFEVIRAKILYAPTHIRPDWKVKEPGVYYMPFEQLRLALKTEFVADGSYGADLSTLTALLAEEAGEPIPTADYE